MTEVQHDALVELVDHEHRWYEIHGDQVVPQAATFGQVLADVLAGAGWLVVRPTNQETRA